MATCHVCPDGDNTCRCQRCPCGHWPEDRCDCAVDNVGEYQRWDRVEAF